MDPAVVRALEAIELARTQIDRPTRLALEPGAKEVVLRLDVNIDEDCECNKCDVPIPVGGSTLRLRRRGAIPWVAATKIDLARGSAIADPNWAVFSWVSRTARRLTASAMVRAFNVAGTTQSAWVS